ncbi:MAG TPA: MBL fold metallo-hydrolase, partial [Chthoniobacterales bacterium]
MNPLEDNFSDVIGKAQRGMRLSDTELAEKARVSSQKIRQLREGTFDELAVARVAPVLGLAARQLCDLAQGRWQPKKIRAVEGFEQFTTNYHDMTVNS